MENYRRVTKEEFFNFIGDKDVVSKITNNNSPYKSTFSYRHGSIVGKTEDYHDYNKNCVKLYPQKTRYYLKNEN